MKKIFALLLALVLVVGLVPVDVHAASCAPGEHVWFENGANVGRCKICYSKCLHEDTFVNVGNCENPNGAYRTEKCNICKAVVSSELLTGGHKFVGGICTVCGAAEKVECEHTWDSTSGKCSKCFTEHDHKIETVYGFCTNKDAYNTQFCNGCGKSFGQEKVSGAHNIVDGKCTRCGYEEVECDHAWKAASELCTKCGYKCPHEKDEIIRANCVDTTKRSTRRCVECHYTLQLIDVPGEHTMVDGKCTVCGYEEDPNCDHEWDVVKGICEKCGKDCKHTEKEVIVGKCDEEGAYTTTRCVECHKNFEKVPVPGKHTMKDGKCTVCGFEEKPDCKHVWEFGNEYCTECGAKCEHGKTEVVYGNCVDPNKYETTRCADCHYPLSFKPVSGKHDFDADGVCKKCGYKEDPNCEHDWDRVTGICKKCGKKCEHGTTKWTYQDCILGKYNTHMCVTCLKVLEIVEVPGYHTFQDGICIRCGAKDPTYVPPTTPTTPDEDLDDVPKTGDNAFVIMTAMTGVALLSAAVYVFEKKRRAC